MFEIRCFCCDLLLGETKQEIEMICPLCVRLRGCIKQIIGLEWVIDYNFPGGGYDWENKVWQLDKDTNNLHEYQLISNRIDGAA